MAEGDKKFVSAGNIKEGNYIIIEDVACRVTNVQISRPGKHGHAKVRMEGVGLIDEKKRVTVMPGHDNVDVPIVGKRNATVLSVHENSANVMDTETFETFDLSVPEELKETCVEGVTILYWIILGDKTMKQVKGGE